MFWTFLTSSIKQKRAGLRQIWTKLVKRSGKKISASWAHFIYMLLWMPLLGSGVCVCLVVCILVGCQVKCSKIKLLTLLAVLFFSHLSGDICPVSMVSQATNLSTERAHLIKDSACSPSVKFYIVISYWNMAVAITETLQHLMTQQQHEEAKNSKHSYSGQRSVVTLAPGTEK